MSNTISLIGLGAAGGTLGILALGYIGTSVLGIGSPSLFAFLMVVVVFGGAAVAFMRAR